ncbi:hypothetical protein F5883DRAFT_639957 [Diaporthe sp. PMI_573]|nr:hypothetical protein F5883DRAFT_639957 [Diaporthaceae sp. PMI_573]
MVWQLNELLIILLQLSHHRTSSVPKQDAQSRHMDTVPPTDDNAEPNPEQRPAATAERSKLWFDETVVVPDAFRNLLLNYSRIPAADVEKHVIQIVT